MSKLDLDGTKKLKTDANTSTTTIQQDSFHGQDKQEGQDGGSGEAEVEEGEDEDGHGSQKPTTITFCEGPVAAGINPLENSLILNHLFKLCRPAGLLANCRLVCKQWYQESLATWRTNFPIIFTNGLIGEDYRLVLYNPALGRDAVHVQLDKFLEYWADPQNQCATKPYRNIRIEFSDFSSTPFNQLWTTIGINLTTLNLSCCSFKNVEEFRTIVFKTSPNLQTLRLDACDFNRGDGDEDWVVIEEYQEPVQHHPLKSLHLSWSPLPISWLELFSNFRSLNYFSVELEPWESETVLEGFSDAIRAVRKKEPNALPFKLMDFRPRPGPDISILDPVLQTKTGIGQELGLPIRTLEIHSKMTQAHVKQVLEFNAERLKEIKVTGYKATYPLGQSFPFGVHLGHLSTLKTKEYLCENLEFLKFTPALEYLAITDRFDSVTTKTNIISNSGKQEMATVMRALPLKVLQICCILTDEDLATLFEWLPNLTSLELVVDDKQFGIVCGSWKNLTSLTSRGWELTDAGLTGIDNLGEGKKRAGKKKMKLKPATRPNITDLQSLEEFKFWSLHITDQSVFHGFLKMPRLRQIEFCSDDRRDELDWETETTHELRKRNIKLVEPTNADYWVRNESVN